MLESYNDIRKRIQEPPKWFDEHGVPRYDDFHPSLSPNVYAREVLLYEIECQACGAKFQVEDNWDGYRDSSAPLSECVKSKAIHFGDPPCWDEDCASGATMNSIPRKTIQFWSRPLNLKFDWGRRPELEGLDLTPEWAKDE